MAISGGERPPPVKAAGREIRAWCLYDWANSAFATTVLAAILPIYFAHIVPESGVTIPFSGETGRTLNAPSLWAYAVSLSLLVVALSSPVLGTIADYTAAKKRFLGTFAFLGSLCTALLFFVSQGQVWRCLLLFMAANVGFAGGNVFYNAFLPQLAGPEAIDRISGRGYAYGYLGGGILLALNLLMIEKHRLFGIPDPILATRLCFVSVGVWWALFTIPALVSLDERSSLRTDRHGSLLTYGFKEVARTLARARRFRELIRFLIAFLIYNDGIQTVIVMAAMFGRTELQLDAGVLLATLLMIQIVGIPGALLLGLLAERIGAKRALLLALCLWTGVVCYAVFIKTATQFVALSALVGLILGGSQAVSRSLYGRFVPAAYSAEFFGFYAISNKFASILGPLLFGLVADLTGNIRLSVLSTAVFFLAGMILLGTVNVERGIREVTEAV